MAKQLNVDLAFRADTSQAQKSIQELQNSLNKVGSIQPKFGMSLTKEMQSAVSSAKELKVHINNALDAKTGNLDLSKLNASLKASGTDLATLSSNLLKAGISGEQAFMSIQRSVAQTSVQIKQANGLLAEFWTTLKNTARWQLSSSMLHGFMGAMQSAYGYAQDLDKSLNNIRIVTGYNVDTMAQFAEQANKAAKVLSTTTTGYTDAALIFYQQGLSEDDVTKRTDTVIKMANVTGESAQSVSNYMTAIWNNFDDGSKSLEYYADVMTALGAATASSTDEIAAGLEKFAAISETVGLSYEYATSALATVTAETRQSADVVGTAFKTIFARVQGLSLGETLEDGVDLNKYSAALQTIGVAVLDANGNMRQMDAILEDMGAKWQTLSDAQKTAVAQTVAGVRQYSQLMALMNNWDVFKENLNTAYGSEGSLQGQAEIYEDSWAAASKRVRASLEGLYNDLIPKDFIVSMTNAIADIITAVDALVNGFGGLQGILLLVANIALTKLGPSLTNGINQGITKVGEFVSKVPGMIANIFSFKPATTGVAELVNGISKINDGLVTAEQHSEYFATNFTKAASESLTTGQSLNTKAIEIASKESIILSDSFKQYMADTGKVYNLQGLIEQNASRLTQEEKERLQIMQQQTLELAAQKAEAQAVLEAAQRANERKQLSIEESVFTNEGYSDSYNKNSPLEGFTNLEGDIKIGGVMSAITTNISAANESTTTLASKWTNVIQSFIDANVQVNQIGNKIAFTSTETEGIGKAASGAASAYGNVVSVNEKINNILKQQGVSIKDKQKAIAQIIREEKTSGRITDDMVKSYLKGALALKNSAGTANTLRAAMSQAQGQARQMALMLGNSEEHLNDVRDGVYAVVDAANSLTEKQIAYNNQLDQTIRYLTQAGAKSASLGGMITAGLQGLSTIAMGVNSISNAIKTLGDDSAGLGEQLTALSAGLINGFNMVRTSIAGVSGILSIFSNGKKAAAISSELLAVATNSEVDAMEREITSTSLSTLMSKLKEKADASEIKTILQGLGVKNADAVAEQMSAMAKEGNVVGAIKLAAANVKLAATEYAVLWPLLLVVAAIAALAAIIWVVVTAEDAETKALKQTTAALEEASSAYDKAKDAVQSFKDQVSDYNEAIAGLNALEAGTDKMREAIEEANKKARELIETFKLFGQYSYGANGEIILNKDALDAVEAGLRENEIRAERAYNLAALRKQEAQTNFDNKEFAQNAKVTYDVVYTYTTDPKGAHTITGYLNPNDYENKTSGSTWTHKAADPYAQYTGGNTQTEYAKKYTGTLSADNFEIFHEIINSLDEVPANAEELAAAVKEKGEEFGLPIPIIQDIDSMFTGEVFETIMSFNEGMNSATAASLYYAEQLLGLFTDDEYKAGISRAAGGDKTTEDLMYKAKDAMLSGATINYNGKTMTMAEYTQARGEELDIATGNRTGNAAEKQVKSNIKHITGENGNTWLKNSDNYSAIFGEGKSYSGDINTTQMARDYFEAQGWEIQSLGIENGKIVMSGTNSKTGEKSSGEEFDFDVIQTNWQEMINDYLLDLDISSKVANGEIEGYLNPEAFEAAMTNIVAQGEQFGADWTNAILTGIANGGKFDFSTVFQFLSPEEMSKIAGMSDADIVKTFLGIDVGEDGTSSELIALGFDNATAFADGFRDGLTNYDPKVFQNAMNDKYEALASSYDIDENEFRAYRSQIQEGKGLENGEDTHNNNPIESLNKLKTSDLEQYNEVLNEIALTQARLSRGYKTLGENWEDWNDVMSDTESSAEDVAGVMKDLAPAMADILNWDMSEVELLPASFFQDHWDLIQQVYEGVDGAQEKLNGLATREYLIQLGIDGSGLEGETLAAYNTLDSILRDMPDMEVGMTLDDSGMYDALQALLDAGVLTKDQMNDVLSQIGFTPEIEEKTIDFNKADATKTSTGYDYTYVDPLTQEVRTAHITQEDYAAASSSGQITIPVINGKETTYSGGGGVNVKSPKDQDKKGSGGGSPKKATPTKKSDVVDRYKEIEDKLDDQQRLMDKTSKSADRLWGPARVKAMRDVNKQLETNIDLLKKKRKEAQDNLKIDKEALKNAIKENLDSGLTDAEFNSYFDEKGNFTEYDEILTKLYEEKKAVETAAGNEWNESEQKNIEAIQERIDKVKEAIEQYDETKELIQDTDEELMDAIYEWQDNNYEILNLELELKVEINDANMEMIEYYMSKIEDNVYASAEAFGYMNQQMGIYNNNLQAQDEYAKKLEEDYYAGNISLDAYKEGLRNVQSATIENLQSLEEVKQSMREYYGEILDMALEEIAIYTNEMEHLNSVLDHYSNIMELIGKQDDTVTKGKILNSKANNLRNELNVQKKLYEESNAEAEKWAKLMLTVIEGSNEYETYKANWQAAQQAANDAQDAMLSKAEEWAEAMKAVIENELAGLSQELEKALTGGTSFDELLTSMERRSSLQEEYLTTTNQIYETNKLMRQAQQEIDKTTNSVAKQKLANFINETEQMQNQAELSQYELDIQQAKYDLLLAEIALEEAQNAKSTVRLQRDSEGNFGYVYTADQAAVSDAEQNLADKQNALYNLGLEGANGYSQKYAETMQEAQDAITELTEMWMNGEIKSEEEYQRRKAKIQDDYYKQLKQYSNLYQVALTTDSNVIQEAWSSDFNDMIYKTEDWKIATDDYFAGATESMKTWSEVCGTVLEESGLDNVSEMVEKISIKSEDLKNTLIGKDGESGVVGAMMSEVEAAGQLSDAYIGIQNQIDEVIKKYEKMMGVINKDYTNTNTPKVDPAINPKDEQENDTAKDDAKTGKSTAPELKVGSTVTVKKNASKWASGESIWNPVKGNNFKVKQVDGEKILIGDPSGPNYSASGVTGWIKKTDLEGFATGGYTGDWAGSYGKLAFLHQKELVLNKEDTSNLLMVMETLDDIIAQLNLQTQYSQLSNLMSPSYQSTSHEAIEQNVHIEASFPGVSSSNEIEEALNNLINQASQYANRK